MKNLTLFVLIVFTAFFGQAQSSSAPQGFEFVTVSCQLISPIPDLFISAQVFEGRHSPDRLLKVRTSSWGHNNDESELVNMKSSTNGNGSRVISFQGNSLKLVVNFTTPFNYPQLGNKTAFPGYLYRGGTRQFDMACEHFLNIM